MWEKSILDRSNCWWKRQEWNGAIEITSLMNSSCMKLNIFSAAYQWWYLSITWCHFVAYTLGRAFAMWLLTQCDPGHECHSSRSCWITGLHKPAYQAQPQYQWKPLCRSNHSEVFLVQYLCRQLGGKPTMELCRYEESFGSLWKDFKVYLLIFSR